jgi:hypothetical protein
VHRRYRNPASEVSGIGFLILDAGPRAGEAWRQRWDTLELTPARYSSLPGMRFPGSPGHYPGKDEVAGYLHAYAHAFDLPIRYNTRVTSLERAAGGYRLHTSAGGYDAGQVIVATGAYQQPWTPALAAGLSGEVIQLHSAAYRNPGQIPSGKVLVAGAANSGAQIAADLAGCLVEIYLAAAAPGDHGHGETAALLASTTAAADGTWTATLSAGQLSAGTSVTATATTPASFQNAAETSEYSRNVTVT